MDKSTELQTQETGIERIIEESRIEKLLEGEKRVRLQNFQKLIHVDPWQHETLSGYIQKHPIHGNPYIPIGVLEMLMDQVFFGLWGHEIKKQHQVLNEYVVSITLWYNHPVTGERITRAGIGATAIQQDSGAKPDELVKKKVRAMEKDAGHALANAKKNAIQTIGRLFGRDVGRNHGDTLDEFTGVINEKQKEKITRSIDEIIEKAKKGKKDGPTKKDK